MVFHYLIITEDNDIFKTNDLTESLIKQSNDGYIIIIKTPELELHSSRVKSNWVDIPEYEEISQEEIDEAEEEAPQ